MPPRPLPITVKTFTGDSFSAHEAAEKADEKANEWLAANQDEPIGLEHIHVTSAACADGGTTRFIHAITVVYRPSPYRC